MKQLEFEGGGAGIKFGNATNYMSRGKAWWTENSSPRKSLLQWPHRHRLFLQFSKLEREREREREKRGGKGNPLPGVGERFKYLISSFPLYRAFLNPISTLL